MRRDGRRRGFDATIIGNDWYATGATPLFCLNPLGGDCQRRVGGWYHAVEMFSDCG